VKGSYRLGDVVNHKSATTLPGDAEIAENAESAKKSSNLGLRDRD